MQPSNFHRIATQLVLSPFFLYVNYSCKHKSSTITIDDLSRTLWSSQVEQTDMLCQHSYASLSKQKTSSFSISLDEIIDDPGPKRIQNAWCNQHHEDQLLPRGAKSRVLLLLLLSYLPQVKGDQNHGAIHAVLPDCMYIKVDAEKIIFRVQSKEPGHQKTSPLDVSLLCWFWARQIYLSHEPCGTD